MIDPATRRSLELNEETTPIYKLLVSSVRDYAIFLLDREGYVVTWNAGAEAAKLYTTEEIVGQHFSVFYTPEDRAAGLPAKLLGIAIEEGRVEDEGWRVRKNGSRFWADVVLTTLYDDTGKHIGFAKVTRDLTEKRHLVREREEAMQASSAKSAFLANMSHELRTPLTAIIGYAEMLDEQADEISPEDLRQHVGRILYSGRHLLSIISDILDLSKIEADHLELVYSTVNVEELLAELVDNITSLARCKGNTINVVIQQDLPTIFVDRLRLRQILYNLFSNAVKFTQDGQISAEAHTENSDGTERISITIRDTGVGMTPEEAAIVFDRFRQVEAHKSTVNQGGTGLGLTICKLLAEAMGGDISVVSAPGEGSAFTVRLLADPAPRTKKVPFA
jgi:PAS domain S-box-containing protein